MDYESVLESGDRPFIFADSTTGLIYLFFL